MDPRSDLAEHTFISKYARFLPAQSRYETYEEACKRVCDMHRTRFLGVDSPVVDFENRLKLSKAIDEIEVALKEKRILGSQRAMQFGGKAILDKHVRQYNCSSSFLDRPEAFAEMLWVSLCGCGYGASLQKHHVAKLPPLALPTSSEPFVIEDSIEGWADAAHALIQAFFNHKPLPIFDFSKIRPEGAPLSSCSATAPGPEPLRIALQLTGARLVEIANRPDPKMRPIDALDTLLTLLECVRAGGIRRVAGIVIFSKDDMEMMDAKTGNWFETHLHRRLSNNSVMLVREDCTRAEFERLIQSAKEKGEPGFYLASSTEHSTNACVPGGTPILTDKGEVCIETVLGKEVNIWNGEEFTPVVPFDTGIQKIYRVELSDGRSLECTANHKWCIETKYGASSFRETINLTLGDLIADHTLPDGTSNRAVITSLIDTQRSEQTYCFTEPKTNRGTFNGIVTGQCCEIGFDPHDAITEMTAIAFCNLTSVNVAACKTEMDFYEVSRLAAILGTLQAAYTNLGYLNKFSPAHENVLKRDALLGVSLTGMADNPTIAFHDDILQLGAQVCRQANTEFANLLGINPAARITCVKPEGSGSLVLKAGNGIHPHHSRRYIRHVEGGKADLPINQFLAAQIPEMVVPSAYKKGEVCLRFPIDLGEGDLWLKQDTTAVHHLELVKKVQQNWVVPGTVRGTLTHNVSNTIQVRDAEWDKVGDYIFEHRDNFAGVSLLGTSGDLDYPQAPFVAIPTIEEAVEQYKDDPVRLKKLLHYIVDFAELTAKWNAVGGIDWTAFRTTQNNEAGVEVVACAGGNCLI